MTTPIPADVEQVVVAYLRSRDEVTDLSDRIGTRTPTDTSTPWVRITRIGGAPTRSRPLWVDSALVQIDTYGGETVADARIEAHDLMAACRAVLAEIADTDHADAVVTKATFGTAPRLPDATFEPPRERYALTVTILCHPLTLGS